MDKGEFNSGIVLMSRYSVNTQYPRPHGVVSVNNLVFSTTDDAYPLLLTTAKDGSVKTWHVRQAKKTEHGGFFAL